MSKIKFGTDGWRAVIAEKFTFENVRKVAHAYCEYLCQNNFENKAIVIGYDTRFLSDKFSEAFAEIALENEIEVYLSDRFIPTPVLSYSVKKLNVAGGVMITASHNPHFYNGIKFKDSYGGPVLPLITLLIEKNISIQKKIKSSQKKIKKTDLISDYNNHIFELINFEILKKFKGKIIINPMFGSGIGILERFLNKIKINHKSINNQVKYDFGGIQPEPIISNLTDLKKEVLENKATIGVALDGDADRFGIIDENGDFVDLYVLMALFTKYLIETKKWKGNIVRTISMADMVDVVAQNFKRKVFEVPVGFKNVTEIMLHEDILIGGEESGGFGYKNHIPERDGIFSILLLLEMLAFYDKPISELVNDLHNEYGTYYYDRIDKHFDLKILQSNMVTIIKNPPDKINSIIVEKIDQTDGIKIYLRNSAWILIRVSQTEPLARIYVCSKEKQQVNSLLQFGEKLITELEY